MHKALKQMPNIISVESIVGISYAKDVSDVERKNHDKATEHTFYKQRQVYLKKQKEQKHQETMQNSYHRRTPVVNSDL